MKIILICIITTIVFIQSSSPNDRINQDHSNYTSIDLEGNWTLIKAEIIEEKQSVEKFVEVTESYKLGEWSPPVYVDNDGVLVPHGRSYYLSKTMKDFVFSEDSIYGMNYPLELLQKHSYTIESNLLQIGNDKIKKTIVLSSDKDTLRFSYLDHYGLYLEETYVKATFNDSILNILKLYNINYPLLAGTWRLVREGGGYDGYDAYDIEYPFDIPDTLVITKEELESTLYTDRSYNMMTDEKKQKYFLGYYDSQLRLIPDNWYSKHTHGAACIRLRRIREEK
jgi:hypothetical protein